jgi:hypothetical protein
MRLETDMISERCSSGMSVSLAPWYLGIMSCAGVVSEGSRREREEYRVSAGKRIDVQEGKCFFRFEELVAGDFAFDYFAEDADRCHF